MKNGKNDLGKKIRTERLAKGLTQGELAAKAGVVHPQIISNIETGHVLSPRLSTLKSICKALDINFTDFLNEFKLISPVKNTIGKKIRAERIAKGLTQQVLADKAGINCKTLLRIENGDEKARLSTLKSICEVLDIDFMNFLNEFRLMSPVEDTNTFGVFIRDLRLRNGYSLYSASKRLKMFDYHLERIEMNEIKPTHSEMQRICRLYELDLNDVVQKFNVGVVEPKVESPKTLGQFLKSTRKRKKLSLANVAELSGVAKSLISLIEKDKITSVQDLLKILIALELEPYEVAKIFPDLEL